MVEMSAQLDELQAQNNDGVIKELEEKVCGEIVVRSKLLESNCCLDCPAR